MKKILLIIISIFVFSVSSFSQDIIYKIDGTTIDAKIHEITLDFVKYYKWEQQSGSLRNIAKADVFMIKYEDGTEEILKKRDDSKNTIPTTNETTPSTVSKETNKLVANKNSNLSNETLNSNTKREKSNEDILHWGISAGYINNQFNNSVSKQVYGDGVSGFEIRLLGTRKKWGVTSLFIGSSSAKGNPIEIGNVPSGSTSEINIVDYGIYNTFFIAKYLTLSLRTGGFSVEERLQVSNQQAMGKQNGFLFAVGAGLNLPISDKFGIRGNVNLNSRTNKTIEDELNSFSYSLSLYVMFQ
ncbi:MAG: hypothetical protein IMY72_08140 [Bacteroidetes bacterium]|nr:hypothetical protein [Bacteroidota bacterium]